MTIEDRIRSLLRYDPKTGNLFWIACPVPDGQTQAATWESLKNRPAGQRKQNRKQHRNNKSGFPGVRWHKRAGKWEAFVRYHGKLKYLGLFETAELAAKAARSARQGVFGAFFRGATVGQ
jgi:hypothetical protein